MVARYSGTGSRSPEIPASLAAVPTVRHAERNGNGSRPERASCEAEAARISYVGAGGPIRLLMTVDTEEDQWGPGTPYATTRNARRLPALQRLFQELGVRPTYFVAYQMAADPYAAAVLRELAEEEGVEIGAHLHPWNTPPCAERVAPRDSMLKNLDPSLQRSKLVALTNTLARTFRAWPSSFRAGRLGLGTATVSALAGTGYHVDSSVAPYFDWRSLDDGPDFVGAPIHPYRLGVDRDVRVPDPGGPLLEIPLSTGFTRRPFRLWQQVHSAFDTLHFRGRSMAGVLSRTGVVRKVALSPELDEPDDMLRLAQSLVDAGARHLQVFFHSSTLVPGLTPFTRTEADVQELLTSIRIVVEGIRSRFLPASATVKEFGRSLASSSGP